MRTAWMYYDRRGRPIEMLDWARRMEDEAYKRVGRDEIGPLKVSTVWLGLNHNYGGGPPLIFETMVFDTRIQVKTVLREETFDEAVEMWRWATEEAALAGHDQAVMWAREQVLLSPDVGEPIATQEWPEP